MTDISNRKYDSDDPLARPLPLRDAGNFVEPVGVAFFGHQLLPLVCSGCSHSSLSVQHAAYVALQLLKVCGWSQGLGKSFNKFIEKSLDSAVAQASILFNNEVKK